MSQNYNDIDHAAKLISRPADADDSKVNALYALLEKDMPAEDAFALTDDQMQILE